MPGQSRSNFLIQFGDLFLARPMDWIQLEQPGGADGPFGPFVAPSLFQAVTVGFLSDSRSMNPLSFLWAVSLGNVRYV